MTSWPITVPGTSALPSPPICRSTSSTSRSMAWDETGRLVQAVRMPLRTFSRSNSSRRPSRFTTSWAAVNGRSTVVKRRPQRAHSRRRLMPSLASRESVTRELSWSQ